MLRASWQLLAIGFVGLSTSGAGTAPTGQKPESKLWWNDGIWWASLYTPTGFHIHRLDRAKETWIDTGVVIDTRANSRADAVWDGTKLYVSTHVSSTSPATGYPGRLNRYSYDRTLQIYTLDAGFPVSINNDRSESLVIGKDSTGRSGRHGSATARSTSIERSVPTRSGAPRSRPPSKAPRP